MVVRGAKEQNKGPPMGSVWEVSDVRSKRIPSKLIFDLR